MIEDERITNAIKSFKKHIDCNKCVYRNNDKQCMICAVICKDAYVNGFINGIEYNKNLIFKKK